MHILVVEDDPQLGRLLQRLLREENHPVGRLGVRSPRERRSGRDVAS